MGSSLPRDLAGPIDGTVAVVSDLVGRLPLYLLTNWPAEKFPLARKRFAFIDWFDGAVVSGEVGVAKPDPAIFDLLCERFGLTPRRTVFVDDSPRNVDAANQLGFRALRFTSPDQLRADLVALGVLDEPAVPP